jgi:hypothetical protein
LNAARRDSATFPGRGVVFELRFRKTTPALRIEDFAMKTALVALARAFWKDERGFIVSAELVLVSTITVLSMIVGLTSISQAVNNELLDVANAFNAVNQGNGFNQRGRNRGRRFTTNNGGIVPR